MLNKAGWGLDALMVPHACTFVELRCCVVESLMLHKTSLEVLMSCVDVVDVDVVWMYCNADTIIVIS